MSRDRTIRRWRFDVRGRLRRTRRPGLRRAARDRAARPAERERRRRAAGRAQPPASMEPSAEGALEEAAHAARMSRAFSRGRGPGKEVFGCDLLARAAAGGEAAGADVDLAGLDASRRLP